MIIYIYESCECSGCWGAHDKCTLLLISVYPRELKFCCLSDGSVFVHQQIRVWVFEWVWRPSLDPRSHHQGRLPGVWLWWTGVWHISLQCVWPLSSQYVWPLSSQCVASFLTVCGLFPHSAWPLSSQCVASFLMWPLSSQCVAFFLTMCGLFSYSVWPLSTQFVAFFLTMCGLFSCSVWPVSLQCVTSFLTVSGLFPHVASFLAVCGLFPHNVWPLSLQSAESSVWTVVFSSPAHFWVFSGTCVSLATSHCHSVSFCIALCAVSALNSQALQSEACISAAKHKR